MTEAVRVKPETMRFDELMLKIRDGKIRIPDFQREFVWDISQIVSLLDSIYHHFPIGSFLFWQTDDEIQSYRRVGEIELQHDTERAVQYVLDGQQRLTSLFASLEQASIAHRVNGKKVTKGIQVYFDLDESSFVANPFDRTEPEAQQKRRTFRFLPGEKDYLAFLEQFLRMIEADRPSRERVLEWLLRRPDMAVSRAQGLNGQFRDMGLYRETADGGVLTELGTSLLSSNTSRTMLSLLAQRIEYFDELLPQLVHRDGAAPAELAGLLAEATGEEVKEYKITARLRWLEGIGICSRVGPRFVLSNDGRIAVEELLREREIQKRDLEEQEQEKKQRYFSVRQITDINSCVILSTIHQQVGYAPYPRHGIESAMQERVYEPFFTNRNVGEGTGLGLSVVHGIVSSLMGTIHVTSQPGLGTSFHVLLPAKQIATPVTGDTDEIRLAD